MTDSSSCGAHTDDNPAAESIDSGETLSWVVHPLKRKPLVSILTTVFIFIIVLGVRYSMDSAGFAGLAMVILFASLAKFYFPTSYTLSEKGITIKTTTQTLKKEWKLYRSCYPDKRGIFLSPFEGRSRLENFRGIYLLCNDNVSAVSNFVKKMMAMNNNGEVK